MKKTSFLLLLVLLGILTACSNDSNSELTTALINMQNLESYRLYIHMNVNDENISSSEIFVDKTANYEQINVFALKLDVFAKENGNHIINRQSGFPVLEYSELHNNDEDDYDDFTLFDGYEFTKVDDYWELAQDDNIFEGVTKIRILVIDELVSELIIEGTINAMDTELRYYFDQYNSIEVEVPIYTTQELVNQKLTLLDDLDLSFSILEDGFSLLNHDDNIRVTCGASHNNTCRFDVAIRFYYDFINDEFITENSQFTTLSDLKEAHPEIVITEDIIEFIEFWVEYNR